MTNGRGKSDSSTVPAKSPNKAEGPAAEATEGRGLAKGNSPERNAFRTQGREDALSALERVRQAANRGRKQRFTALFHHIYDVERLRTAYLAIKKDAAAGVDGETWEHYGEALEANLQDLSHRLSEERTERDLYVGFISRRWVNRVSSGHLAFPRWKTKSSSVPPSRC
jgi:RNA-directed DNA polymerase